MKADCAFCAGPDEVRTAPAEKCEIVVYGSDHGATLGRLGTERVRQVVDFWAARTALHGARLDAGYVLVTADGRDPAAHPHGEIYVFRMPPPVAVEELNVAPCPVCLEDPGDRLVAEALGWRAWTAATTDASRPYSVVLAPMSHRPDLPTLAGWERDALAQLLIDVLARFDRLGTGHVLWVHQRPTDGVAWPNAHVHVEVSATPRTLTVAEMGSGAAFDKVAPHEAAQALRAPDPTPTPTATP